MNSLTKICITSAVIGLIVGFAVITAVGNMAQWRVSLDNFVDARNALEENITLMDAQCEWEKASGISDKWTSARDKRIAELKNELDEMYSEFNKMDSLPLYEQAIFSSKKARYVRVLKTMLEKNRTESIVGVATSLGESEKRRQKTE